MKVHVFDTYVTIKDREGHPDMDDTLLEKLDEMLTTYTCAGLKGNKIVVLQVRYFGNRLLLIHLNRAKEGGHIIKGCPLTVVP